MRRGRCPHRPVGTVEFAADFRKIGFVCRVDVGIDPYEPRRKLSARTERFGIYDRKMPYIFSGALKPSRSMHVSSTRRVRSISAT